MYIDELDYWYTSQYQEMYDYEDDFDFEEDYSLSGYGQLAEAEYESYLESIAEHAYEELQNRLEFEALERDYEFEVW